MSALFVCARVIDSMCACCCKYLQMLPYYLHVHMYIHTRVSLTTWYLVIGNNPTELSVCPDQDHCLNVALVISLRTEVEDTKLAREMKHSLTPPNPAPCQTPHPLSPTYPTPPTQSHLPNPTHSAQPTQPRPLSPTYPTPPTQPRPLSPTYPTPPTQPNLLSPAHSDETVINNRPHTYRHYTYTIYLHVVAQPLLHVQGVTSSSGIMLMKYSITDRTHSSVYTNTQARLPDWLVPPT